MSNIFTTLRGLFPFKRQDHAESYGVFSLERQDLVDLSKRIAQCVPKDFLCDKEKPVIIAVDGTFGCGKKIFADYGRDGLLGINGSKLDFSLDYKMEPLRLKKLKKILKRHGDKPEEGEKYLYRADVLYRGNKDFDEYVRRLVDGHGLEVSFINLAWCGRYSFDCEDDEESHMSKHLQVRKNGGLVYVHNCEEQGFKPDIEICLESKSGTIHVNGHARRCPDVGSVLSLAMGQAAADHYYDWGRYVGVKVNNPSIDQDGAFSRMLRQEFGFVSTVEIDKTVKAASRGKKQPSSHGYPIIKGHAHLACVGRV